jgi:hypothetical protein
LCCLPVRRVIRPADLLYWEYDGTGKVVKKLF